MYMGNGSSSGCRNICRYSQKAQQQSGNQVVMVGAASKGIIQRDYQHNAVVYKSAYAKNPFDSVTDEDLDEYKRVIEKTHRGESRKYLRIR